MQPIELSYNHFCQHKLPEELDIFPEFQGICWFACLQMALEAVLIPRGQSREDIYNKLVQATIGTKSAEVEEIISGLEQQGRDMSVIHQLGQYAFIDMRTGDGGNKTLEKDFPSTMSLLYTALLFRYLDVSIEVRICGDEGHEELFDALYQLVADGSAVIASTLVTHQEEVTGHTIFVGGFESDDNGDYVILSDPNTTDPIRVSRDELQYLCGQGAAYLGDTTIAFNRMLFIVRSK